MRRANRTECKECEHRDTQNRHPLQEFSGAGVRLGEVGCEIQHQLYNARIMIIRIHILVVMLIVDRAEPVVMTAVHIDVLMFHVGHMGMCMAQGRQHQADAQNETEHAEKAGHRFECKRTAGRLAIP